MVKGEYDIQGDRPKTSAKDVSYKSCLCALLIFIAICIIIILCGVNWRSNPKSEPIREKEEVEIFDKEKLIHEGTTLQTTSKSLGTTTRKWRFTTSKMPLPLTTKPPLPVTTSKTILPLTTKPPLPVTTSKMLLPLTTKPPLLVTTSKMLLPLTTKPPLPVTTSKPHTLETKGPEINMSILTTTTTTSEPQIPKTKLPILVVTTTSKPTTQTTTTSEPQISKTKGPVSDRNTTSTSNETATSESSKKSETTEKWKSLQEKMSSTTLITSSTIDSITQASRDITSTRKWRTKVFIQRTYNGESESTTEEDSTAETTDDWYESSGDYSTSETSSSTEDYGISSTDSTSTKLNIIKNINAGEENQTENSDYYSTNETPSSTDDDEISSIDFTDFPTSTTSKLLLRNVKAAKENQTESSSDYSTSEMPSSTEDDEISSTEFTHSTSGTSKLLLKYVNASKENQTESSGDYSTPSTTVDDEISSTDFTDFASSTPNVLLRNVSAAQNDQIEAHVVFISTTPSSVSSTTGSTPVKNYVSGSTTEYANKTVSQTVDATTTPISKINDTTTAKSLPIPLDKIEPVCHTSGCKSAASRMLSLMNHSVDACEDFYEFSCGGMQADNADSDARSRVSRLLNVVNSKSPVFLQKFKKFYDTCVSHEEDFNYEKRLEAVRLIINSVGTIDTNRSLGNIDLTKLFAKLVMYESMPLMDVQVDLDKHSSKYILQLTLPQGRPASRKKERWSALLETQRRCLEEERCRIYEPNLNLTEIHDRYLTCNKNYTGYLNSLERTLEVLGFYSHFNESLAETKIRAVRFGIDFDMLRYFTEEPSLTEIRKAVSDRDYTIKKVGDLQRSYPLLQWSEFFRIISGHSVSDSDLVQVYFLNHFHYVFKELQNLPKWKLNNELLGIFAQDLFENLVIPKYNHHRHEYCLDLSSSLFHDVISYWYMKSLSYEEIKKNEARAEAIFKQMISNLTTALNSEEWLDDSSRISIAKKAQSLQLYFPDKKCKCLSDVALSGKYDLVNLTDEYPHNLIMMKELRKMSLYSLAGEDFENENTFCHFIYPFDKDPLSFYANPFIAVPMGLFKSIPKNIPDYVTIPRIGIYLAREIGRHFDPVGIYYKMALSETSNGIYNMSKETTQNMLSFATTRNNTSQMVTFKPSGFLSINQRMAENTALRLLTDSYESLIAKNNKQLPWISTSYTKDELYFISIAQEYCHKTDTLEYMLKLFESDSLPASLRVENMMSNSNSFSTVFKCREGATLNNVVDRVQFPYFPKFEYEDNYDINS